MSQSKRGRKRSRQARRGGPKPPRQPSRPATPAPPQRAASRRDEERSATRVARPTGRMDRMIERADQRPKPPWHPVPLVEISVLVGIVLLVLGFINADNDNGRLAIAVGLTLASLAGLDTAAREHFTGYRSHSTLLAGLPGVGTLAILAVLRLPLWVALLGGLVVFGAVFLLARRAFQRRAGVGFKL